MTTYILIRFYGCESVSVSPERERSPRRRHRRRNRHRPTGMGARRGETRTTPDPASGRDGGDARRRGAENTSRRETPDDRAARGPRQRRRHAHSCVPDHGREPRSNQHELQRPEAQCPRPQARPRGAARACGPRSTATGTRHPSSSSPLRSSPKSDTPPLPSPPAHARRTASRIPNTAIGIGSLPGSRPRSRYTVFRVTRYATLHRVQSSYDRIVYTLVSRDTCRDSCT